MAAKSAESEAIVDRLTAWDRLQEMYRLMGHEDEIIWDAYKCDQKEELYRKVMLAMGVNEQPEKPDDEKSKKTHQKYMELVDKICKSIWRQAKYTGGSVVMAITYLCMVPVDSTTLAIAQLSTQFTMTPVFRIMKCVKSVNDNSARDCCMIFVDVNARVYANWEAFCKENILPECIVVAPKKGIFMGKKVEDEWLIALEKMLSPAATPDQKFARGADTTASYVGMTAAGVLVGGLMLPVLAPLAGAAAVTGGACSLWSAYRSGKNLSDRSEHEQSIKLSDAEARASWLGVAGGTLGVASGVAGKAVASMATNGKNISTLVQHTVTGLNVSTLVVSGAGTINGFVDILFVNDDQPVSKLQLVQLSTSLFMFTHSVYNFQMTSTIIEGHQDMTIKQMRENLSRNQGRAFDKMAKETMRLNSKTGKADIIRSLRKIPDQKSYFRDMYKMNKQLNNANVKPSFSGNAEPHLNSQPSNAMPSEIRANLRAAPAAQVFQEVPAHNPSLGSSTAGKLPLSSVNNPVTWVNTAVRFLSALPHLIGEDTKDTLLNIAEKLNEVLFNKFVFFVRVFIEQFGMEIERNLRRTVSVEEYSQTIFKIFEDKARRAQMKISEYIDELRDERDKNRVIKAEIVEFYNSQAYPVPNKACSVCGGMFYDEIIVSQSREIRVVKSN
ncbi:uncharacterized protein LOC132256331 [Phlebotomus argentipes]|uniref:uncharacterized protein LOC132256331 n=1 Tax=Phlebotomus argentipes TaxID=94469 RepID=UPI002893569F|nr:uncharacterized protein LOC132256331 [Phlebotomus argentipes]